MKRILILGGGVGGTLTANLLVKKLRRQLKAGEVTITVVDQTGQHTYQPGFMYIAMGGERAEKLQRPERGLLDSLVNLVVGAGREGRRADADRPTQGRRAARLRLPRPGDGIAHPARGDRALRHRGAPLLHRRSGAQAAQGARRVQGRPDRGGHRRDALQVPAGTARGLLPDRVGAPRARAAQGERGPFLLADRSCVHDRERVRDGHPDLRAEGRRGPHVLQRRGHRRRAACHPEPRRRGAAVRPPDPRPAAQGPAVPDRLRACPGAGRLAADRPGHAPGGRPPERLRPRRRHGPAALEGGLHGPLRGAGRDRADRRRHRGPRAEPQARRLHGQGHVLLRDRRRQGHRCSSSTTSTRPSRRSRTSSGTWARSSSTRRTGTRCPRAGSDRGGHVVEGEGAIEAVRRAIELCAAKSFTRAHRGCDLQAPDRLGRSCRSAQPRPLDRAPHGEGRALVDRTGR